MRCVHFRLMKHSELKIKKAQILFELQGWKPAAISRETGIPVRTLYGWINTKPWVRQEETAEQVTLAEYKRIILKGELSERDIRKLRILRDILDEYTEHRSLIMQEIIEAIGRLRQSGGNKDDALNHLIGIINKHTGAKIRRKRSENREVKNDFRGIELTTE